ncbi:hypothetical protein AAFL49_14335 [Klebsiella michiganensis]|uniref:hypothetical protein n=1 Tax=Klebsiella michiganensis TaxID=1134687 RepID=UPI00316ABB1D|nr:hypothetical protein [Klebsiella variicola]
MNLQKDLLDINHFYYCLLVALRLRQKIVPFESDNQRKRFIINWLYTAQKRKSFSKITHAEILWLVEEFMKFNKSLPELEACIDKIYQTSLSYLADNCSTAKPS